MFCVAAVFLFTGAALTYSNNTFSFSNSAATTQAAPVTTIASFGDVISITNTSSTKVISGNHIGFLVTDKGPNGQVVTGQSITLCQSSCSNGGLGTQVTNSLGQAAFNPPFVSTGIHAVFAQDTFGDISPSLSITVYPSTTTVSSATTAFSTTTITTYSTVTVTGPYTTVTSTISQTVTSVITTTVQNSQLIQFPSYTNVGFIVLGLISLTAGFLMPAGARPRT